VIAYRALTGYMPFDGNDIQELVECVLQAPPPSASVLCAELPRSVDDFFATALCKVPEGRFQSALELAEAFNDAAAPMRSGEHAVSPFYDADVG
jgi:serine/threonine-protein kinase